MSEMDEGTSEESEAAEEPVDQVSVTTNYQINISEFLKSPIQYANLPHVSFDGTVFHLSFFAFAAFPAMPVAEGPDRPVTMVARIALPPEAVELTIASLQSALDGFSGAVDGGAADDGD